MHFGVLVHFALQATATIVVSNCYHLALRLVQCLAQVLLQGFNFRLYASFRLKVICFKMLLNVVDFKF